jgi:hypothetical protein
MGGSEKREMNRVNEIDVYVNVNDSNLAACVKTNFLHAKTKRPIKKPQGLVGAAALRGAKGAYL